MPFDPLNDLAPIGPIGDVPGVIVVNKDVPAKDLREFVELARNKPGQLNYGSSGSGSPLHLAIYRWARAAGIELTHVPYRGAAPAVTDLLGGRIQVMELGFGVVASHVNAGALRVLAVDAPSRLPALPDVRTVAEFGLAEDQVTTWFGLAAPRGTPDEVVERLNRYLREMASNPMANKRLKDAYIDVVSTSPAQFAARIKSDFKVWERIVKGTGIDLD
jgi:tripartite-type tricarboxylate transporter receptor subunit TctC